MIMQSMLSYQGSQAKSWFNSLSADENSHHKTDHRLDLSPTTARGGISIYLQNGLQYQSGVVWIYLGKVVHHLAE
jgi:hypothetical protein